MTELTIDISTLRSAAQRELDVKLLLISKARFSEPGWFYVGPIQTRCPADQSIIHAFRMHYSSSGRDYFYVACVCTVCRSAVTAAELGLNTSDLGLPIPVVGHPSATRPRKKRGRKPKARPFLDGIQPSIDPAFAGNLERFQFDDLLAECVECLSMERLKSVLRSRLGLGTEFADLQTLAEEFDLSKQRIGQLQEQAVAFLSELALSNQDSAPYRLAVELGLSSPPNHLAIAERIHSKVKDDPIGLARHRTRVWMQMAGSSPSSTRHVTTMVAQQMRALLDWEESSTRGRRNKGTSEILQSWLEDVQWPASLTTTPTLESFSPVRSVGGGESSGSIYLSKVAREVVYESSLERRFFSLLDQAPEVESFVEQPCWVHYEYKGVQRRYCPDVLLRFNDGRMVLVEAKDMLHIVDGVNLAKYEAGQKYANSRGWGWAVCNAGADSLSALRSRTIPSSVVDVFEAYLRRGPINVTGLKQIRKTVSFEGLDVLAMTLQRQWVMQHAPFEITADYSRPSP